MRGTTIRIVVLGLLLGFGGAARAEVIWRGDFQTGDRSQWTSTEAVSTDRLQIVTSPVPEGYEYALKTTLKQGDTVYGGDRSELDYERDRPSEGDHRYYRWMTYWPTDYRTADYWQLFTQWHQYDTGGSPPLAFMAWGEKIQLGNDKDQYFWNAPLERGVWHEFVFHVIWSTSSSVGGVELWYDGEHVLPLKHTATLFPNDTVYLKQGLYRKNVISWEQTLYHCGMTVATELADVMPGVPVEPAPDAGVKPTPDASSPPADAGQPVPDVTDGVDAGTPISETPAPDSGTADDLGEAGRPADPPYGCRSVNVAWPAAVLVAALWLLRRRSRSVT